MDRSAAMLILLGVLVVRCCYLCSTSADRFDSLRMLEYHVTVLSLTRSVYITQCCALMILAFFAVAPITCICLVSLLYSLYLFIAFEEAGVHDAQEFENRFWTVFAILLSTALFFASDSPVAFGKYSPTLGFVSVLVVGYAMNLWDRYTHRLAISKQQTALNLRKASSANSSLIRLRDLGIPVEEQLKIINACLQDIDQLLIPSTINNFINRRFILQKEREIITIFEECDARALNYLIGHVKLGLLFYKIKDHRNFNGRHRTELINLLAVDRLSILTVISRVIVLHSLQLLKLRANPRAEHWVRNILLNTHQDELSELKTLTDAKGDYFCMNKLIFDDIKSESVRQDILNHFRREAAVLQTHIQMGTRRRAGALGMANRHMPVQWRKVLSDVDDTLTSSGGMYPAGIDKRYSKKVVYPGVLAFYRELDIGTQGPDEWQDDHVGNLVFLSARPHVYKDVSERANFAKFKKLRSRAGEGGRQGMHTTPSLLPGDLTSGKEYMLSNDFEPLAKKKFDNFRRYVSIYPEYQHVFVCDNGQGDVRAGEMMFDGFPYEFEAMYVHVVQDIPKTHGYAPDRWKEKEFRPFFFRTYVEAALHAASRNPPLIRVKGLQRICHDTVADFAQITTWPSEASKALRRRELNQAIWDANKFLEWNNEEPSEIIIAERRFVDGEKVRTPYGIGMVKGFDPIFDLYEIDLDWRPLDVQVAEYQAEVKKASIRPKSIVRMKTAPAHLETVEESDEKEDEVGTKGKIERVEKLEPSGGEKPDSQSQKLSVSTQAVGQSSAEESPRTPPRRSSAAAASPPSSLASSPSSTNTPLSEIEPDSLMKKPAAKFGVSARLSGHCLTKFTPPTLPKFDTKQRASLFAFGVPVDNKVIFVEGARVVTPYGAGQIVEYRQRQGFVVVEMSGWHATAYLREQLVKPESKGILGSLIRQLSTRDKAPEFPYAEGTTIETPFGKGKVTRPVPIPRTTRASVKRVAAVPPTIGIGLQSWTLANGAHPVLYSTVETARAWKDHKGDGGSIFSSALGSLVESSKTLFVPFLGQKAVKESQVESPKAVPRYYQDAAAVTTTFGYGVVRAFRPSDGFYEVEILQWTLADGSHPKAYIRKEDISHRVAKGCQEGYPVLTSLGLSGTLASVEPTTGVHIVTIPSAGMVCYLQPDCVIRPLKAAVGEEVMTAYGDGKVFKYHLERDVYEIHLNGWNAILYAKGDTFDRVGDGIQDRDGSFGVDWLLQFFIGTKPRSRSNSIVSGSQSNRSVS